MSLRSFIPLWNQRIQEHLDLFYALLDPSLKTELKRVNDLYKRWTEYNKHQKGDYTELLRDTRQLKTDLIAKTEKAYTGVYLSLLLHTLKELDFLTDIVQGNINDQRIVDFWNDHALDYAKLDPHMIDPTQEDIIAVINNMRRNLERIQQFPTDGAKIEDLITSQLESNKLHQEAQKIHIPSIIHPLLLQHIIVEEQMGIKMLEELLNGTLY